MARKINITIMTVTTGASKERIDRIPLNPASAVLTTGLPNPPVVAVLVARAAVPDSCRARPLRLHPHGAHPILHHGHVRLSLGSAHSSPGGSRTRRLLPSQRM